MELKVYLYMVRRWVWLLLLGVATGTLGGLLVSIFQTPIYQATTRFLVMPPPQGSQADYTYLNNQQLIQTYAQLLTTRPVLEEASTKLGFAVDASQIAIQQINDTLTIQLTVENQNPQHAADIANILLQVLIDQNEAIQTEQHKLTEQSIQAQITQVESQITALGTEINTASAETVQQQQKQVEAQIAALQAEETQLQNEIQLLTSPTTNEQKTLLSQKEVRLSQVKSLLLLYQQTYTDLVVLGKPVSSEDSTTRLSQLQTTLKLYQEIYVNLLNNLESIRLARLQNMPNIVQIEAAAVPAHPVRPRPIRNTGLGAMVGLLLTGSIAFLIEYVDDTIRTPEDIERILQLPVVGYIGDIDPTQGENEAVHVLRYPHSPVSEAFRSLRTNLEFTNVDRTLNKILVTSSELGEGKTTVATNLAASLAQSGKRVLLIDADMRRPRIHSIFGVSNHVGLSTLFRGSTSVRSVIHAVEGIDNIFVMTSGTLPPNPTELLASVKMDHILQEASREMDIIIVDSPPSHVADQQVLAKKLDGVLIIVQPGQTHANAAFSMVEQFRHINTKILGVILNKIPRHNHYYPYIQREYYYYQQENQFRPQLQAKNSPLKLLPQAQSQPAKFPVSQVDAPERFDDDLDARGRVEVYSPQRDIPATRNVKTKPRPQNEDSRFIEIPRYEIKNYQLECWYYEQENDTNAEK